MTESIKVYFEPLNQVAGFTYFHMTLVYTNSAGDEYLATAWASNDKPSGNIISDLASAASAVQSGSTSPTQFGTLITEDGSISALPTNEQNGWLGTDQNPYVALTLDTGDDLSSEWNAITIYGDMILIIPITCSLRPAGLPLPCRSRRP